MDKSYSEKLSRVTRIAFNVLILAEVLFMVVILSRPTLALSSLIILALVCGTNIVWFMKTAQAYLDEETQRLRAEKLKLISESRLAKEAFKMARKGATDESQGNPAEPIS